MAGIAGLIVAILISQFLAPDLDPLSVHPARRTSMPSESTAEQKQDSMISSAPTDAGEASATTQVESEDVVKIETFITTEAKNLDIAKSPAREKQIELLAMARQLTQAQSNRIRDVLQNVKRPVNERILGAYVLSLSHQEFAQNSLVEFGNSELPDFGPVTVHSESEIRRNQEVALRFMAVDRLAELARDPSQTEPVRNSSLEKLKDFAAKNPTEQIRRYAQSTLDELLKSK